jgi:hypothetical protein
MVRIFGYFCKFSCASYAEAKAIIKKLSEEVFAVNYHSDCWCHLIFPLLQFAAHLVFAQPSLSVLILMSIIVVLYIIFGDWWKEFIKASKILKITLLEGSSKNIASDRLNLTEQLNLAGCKEYVEERDEIICSPLVAVALQSHIY